MANRPTIYHVGRAGDIPGGMTQVINAYLAWPFPHVSVKVITSRADPGDHLQAARLLISALIAVRRIARTRMPAVIVVHLSERGSFVREGMIARYAHYLKLPVIAHMHGSEFAAFEAKHPKLVASVLAVTGAVISLSEETSEVCARHISRERIHLVPNAIPEGQPRAKEHTVVFGGVVSARKGIDILQDTWRALAPTGWRLMVAGPVRDAELVDETIPGVTFLGGLKHAELTTLLDAAAVAVLPSRDEAMPMFILEAMARRACVVSTSVGGIPLVLSDGCGVIVPPGDATALTTALENVLRDDAYREQVAERGYRRFAERFSAAAVYPRLEALWLDALRTRRV